MDNLFMNIFQNEGYLELLTCANPRSYGHIVKIPISVSCGHSICKECIPLNDTHLFKCRLCTKENSFSLTNANENLAVKHLLNGSSALITKLIKDYAKISLDLYEDTNFLAKIDEKFDSLRTTIDVRVESLKWVLDKKRDNFFSRLDRIRTEIINMKTNENNNEILKNCRKIIQMKSNCNKLDDIYDYQEKIGQLRKMIDNLNRVDYVLKFKLSDFEIDSNHIGSIQFRKNINFNGESTILSQEEVTQLNDLCEFAPRAQWNLIYIGSRDGYTKRTFEKLCHQRHNLLTIIKTCDDYIIGVFNSQTWDNSGKYKDDKKAFILSFKNIQNKPFKAKIRDSNNAVFCHKNKGLITLGKWTDNLNEHDLFIHENCDTQFFSNSSFPGSFYDCGFKTQDYILAGKKFFLVKEIEVFSVEDFE